jgi:hypothetical protein
MRRYVPLLIAGIAMIAAACRDTIAPTRSGSVSRLESFGAPVAYFTAVTPVQSTTVTFTINPEGGRVKAGDYTLVFPDRAVCDPATSGYGPDTWDLPCETLNQPITITATTWRVGEASYVDFSPDIRFAPEKEVVISIKRKARDAEEFQSQKLYYFRDIGDNRYFIDEAADDQTVATNHDYNGKKVWRRVKHFSGISIQLGMVCDDTVGDPDCVSSDSGFQW